MDTTASGVLAIVPARAGSKGILRKNLSRIGDNTLIGHACQIAVQCPSVGCVVVTSDDSEMGQEGLRNGADLFVHRPDHLATDDTSSADTWRHAWIEAERERGERFDIAVWLQPTSPTRTVEDVEATIQRLIAAGASASITISPVPMHFAPDKLLLLENEGRVTPFIPGSVPNARRQDLATIYWLNGHCYAAQRDTFLRDGVVIPDDAVSIVIDRPVANIDDPEDLELARWIASRQQIPPLDDSP